MLSFYGSLFTILGQLYHILTEIFVLSHVNCLVHLGERHILALTFLKFCIWTLLLRNKVIPCLYQLITHSNLLLMEQYIYTNFVDLFEKLVPLSVHNATVAYDNRKAEIINREVGKLREATQLMNR